MLTRRRLAHLIQLRTPAHTTGLGNVAKELQVIEVHSGQNIIRLAYVNAMSIQFS